MYINTNKWQVFSPKTKKKEARFCTYGVDVAEREVVDVEFLGDVERCMNDDSGFVRET